MGAFNSRFHLTNAARSMFRTFSDGWRVVISVDAPGTANIFGILDNGFIYTEYDE